MDNLSTQKEEKELQRVEQLQLEEELEEIISVSCMKCDVN